MIRRLVLFFVFFIVVHGRALPGMSLQECRNILGVGVDADVFQIKKLYRKAVMRWHPDKNPDNPKLADRKFKEVQEAYEILISKFGNKRFRRKKTSEQPWYAFSFGDVFDEWLTDKIYDLEKPWIVFRQHIWDMVDDSGWYILDTIQRVVVTVFERISKAFVECVIGKLIVIGQNALVSFTEILYDGFYYSLNVSQKSMVSLAEILYDGFHYSLRVGPGAVVSLFKCLAKAFCESIIGKLMSMGYNGFHCILRSGQEVVMSGKEELFRLYVDANQFVLDTANKVWISFYDGVFGVFHNIKEQGISIVQAIRDFMHELYLQPWSASSWHNNNVKPDGVYRFYSGKKPFVKPDDEAEAKWFSLFHGGSWNAFKEKYQRFVYGDDTKDQQTQQDNDFHETWWAMSWYELIQELLAMKNLFYTIFNVVIKSVLGMFDYVGHLYISFTERGFWIGAMENPWGTMSWFCMTLYQLFEEVLLVIMVLLQIIFGFLGFLVVAILEAGPFALLIEMCLKFFWLILILCLVLIVLVVFFGIFL